MIILAIDSGLERTGYALFDKKNHGLEKFKYLTSGLIETKKNKEIPQRIKEIYDQINKIINRYKPKRIVLEQIFFLKNSKTAIKVSQTQGAIMLLAANKNIPIKLLTPLQIKQIITGYGRADKKSVQKMLHLMLHLTKELKQDDTADAIACGLAYCYIKESLV